MTGRHCIITHSPSSALTLCSSTLSGSRGSDNGLNNRKRLMRTVATRYNQGGATLLCMGASWSGPRDCTKKPSCKGWGFSHIYRPVIIGQALSSGFIGRDICQVCTYLTGAAPIIDLPTCFRRLAQPDLTVPPNPSRKARTIWKDVPSSNSVHISTQPTLNSLSPSLHPSSCGSLFFGLSLATTT